MIITVNHGISNIKGPSEKRTTFLKRTVRKAIILAFLDLRQEDNPSIVNKMAGPEAEGSTLLL